jgi:hypothetical protein
VLITLLAVASLASCKRTGPARLHAIYIVDLTASTLEEARAKAFAGIKEPFNKGLLKRGDSVSVIPVTSDALIESQGSILRFDLPTDREVYDQDLQDLSDRVIEELGKMQKKAEANPYPYSDIIGAVKIAGEEFSTDKLEVRKLLVILSDCVQDVKQISFKTASIVANKNNASKAAKEMASTDAKLFNSADIYIGLLRSTDLKNMSPQRREAVETFWTEYFKQTGAKSVHLSTDGPGQLAKFIGE